MLNWAQFIAFFSPVKPLRQYAHSPKNNLPIPHPTPDLGVLTRPSPQPSNLKLDRSQFCEMHGCDHSHPTLCAFVGLDPINGIETLDG
jgi:hypothetical protein